MLEAPHLLEAINKASMDSIYCVYELEAEVMNWLHEGLSHQCSHVFLATRSGVLRPFKTKCGVYVTTRLDKNTFGLYNLVRVDTTCIWCVSGKGRE